MSYEEEERKRSRVVVETPTARREVYQTETSRVPDRRGMSTGVVAAIVIAAVALVTILFLFMMNRQDNANSNVSVTTAQTPVQPVIVQQQPQPQQPIIVQQPAAPVTQPAPIIVSPPASSSTSSSTTTTTLPSPKPNGTDDVTVQDNINKKISADPTLASLNLDIMVAEGKVTLMGSVDTPDLKNRLERLVKTVKGVHSVDNQITVSGANQ